MRSVIPTDLGDRARSDSSFFGQMRTYFIGHARAKGFELIDMQPAFVAHYATHRYQFEFPHDGHWNAIGHGVVVNAVTQSHLFTTFMDSAAARP